MPGDPSLSDAALIAASLDGDTRAFGHLYDRHAPAVTRYAWALVSTPTEAQEVVQDTFLTAWKKLATVRLVEVSVLPWLLVVCRHHALNARRSRARRSAEELPDHLHDREPTEHERAREQLHWVLDEIGRLGERDRRVCELCLIDGLTYKEAARVLGMSETAVGKRLERARVRLRRVVTESDS